MRIIVCLAGALAGLLLTGSAWAQAAAPAPAATQDRSAPAGDVPKTDMAGKAGTLSDKLSTTNGVIHPEGEVDRSIQKPAPATGSMPVIPPPGSPGGRSDIEPK